MAPHWRPRDTGPLHVREGQVTFDAEGVDYLNGPEPFRQPTRMPAFSRILHWPESSSGVTIGRGYDMKDRSAGQIMSELRQAEFEEYKVVICSKAAGLYGRHAREFVYTYRPLVGEITHQQQIRIFEISYQQKRDYARIFYIRFSGEIPGAPSWENLEQCIKDVVVDIFYQSVHNARKLIEAAAQGKVALIKHIKDDSQYMKYETHRKRISYLK